MTYPQQPGPPVPPLTLIPATAVFNGSFDPRVYPYRYVAIAASRHGRDGYLELLAAAETFSQFGFDLVTVTSHETPSSMVAYLARPRPARGTGGAGGPDV